MKKLLWIAIAVVILGLGFFFSRPRPMLTPVATVTRGSLQVEVVEDGITRVRERYIVTAPITGTLRRVELQAGDKVKKGQIVARLNWFQEWRVAAPATGFVLRVVQESEGDIEKGRTIMEIGDPNDLEVVLDVLTEKAILVKEGNPVIITKWGGEKALKGRVSRVEPAGFNKISSLGVEEQRTNVIIQFEDEPAVWQSLGDNYHLEGRIIVDERPQALKIPRSALFRNDVSWALFKIVDNKARLTNVTLGAQGSEEAEVLSGELKEGDLVIPYPSQELRDGIRVKIEKK